MREVKPFRFWLALVALLLLMAVGLELALRLAGLWLTSSPVQENVMRPEDAGKIRILALGESTTDEKMSPGPEGGWPRQLEKELQRQGIDARVYNEGHTAVSSATILFRLPAYLEKYRPRVVISMMGINDDPMLWFHGAPASPRADFLSGLRLVKAAAWLASATRDHFRCRLDMRPLDLAQFGGLIEHGIELSYRTPLAAVEKTLRESIPQDRELALVLLKIAIKLTSGPQSYRALSDGYLRRAFELLPLHHEILLFELGILPANSPECPRVVRTALQCGEDVPDDLLVALQHCSGNPPNPAVESLFRSRGIELSKKPVELQELATPAHYRLLHERLRQGGILHIAMQYPTQPLAKLRAFFENPEGRLEANYQDTIFVSNEENFAAALRQHPYREVFIDHFEGSWGHATALGNQLVARAAARGVLEALGTSVSPNGAVRNQAQGPAK